MKKKMNLFRRGLVLFRRWRKRMVVALLVLIGLALLGVAGFAYYVERMFEEEDIGDSMLLPTVDHRVERQRRRTEDGHEFEVDNSRATFTLDLKPEAASISHRHLFPDHAAAIAYAREHGLNILPSVGLVHDKCKKVNDQLVRALETAMQEDLPADKLPGRRAALQQLAEVLLRQLDQAAAEHRGTFESALVHVVGALRAGGADPPPELPPDLASRAEHQLEEFLADPVYSRPVGFWDQTPELINIFRQDRFLARGICLKSETAAAVALAGTVVDDPILRATFERSAEFGARLTNPTPEYRYSPLRLTELAAPEDSWERRLAGERLREIREGLPAPPPDGMVSFALFPFASSPEEALWLKMPYGFTGAELIVAIESGVIDLEPKPDSGWYDYQWYALETLVMPERGREDHKLETNREYRQRLREIFLAAIARDRETHIKNLPTLYFGCSGPFQEGEIEAQVGPLFAVEPLPTVYLRLARAYRFLQTAMSTLIEPHLHETMMDDPFDYDGEKATVTQVLDRMAALNYGLYELACRDLGMNPEYLEDEHDDEARDAAVLLAEKWLTRLEEDSDLQEDMRIAVPLFIDPVDGSITSWACAGVRLEPLVAEYDEKPRVFGVKPIWAPVEYWVASEVFLEFTHYDKPLTREEFRALCDAHPDEASLRAALGAPPRLKPLRSDWFRAAGWLLVVSALVVLILVIRRLPGQKRKRILRNSFLLILAISTVTLVFLSFAHRLRTTILVEHVLWRSRFLSALAAQYYISCELDESPRLAHGRMLGLLESMAEGRTAQSRYLAAYLIEALYWQSESADNLALIEPETVIPLLLRAAEDQVPQVAGAAVFWLGNYDRPEVVNLIQDKLRSPNTHPKVRLQAVLSAGSLRNPELIDDLCALLQHGSRMEQRLALSSLMKYDTAETREFLLEFLEQRERGKTAEEIEEDFLASRIRDELFGKAEEDSTDFIIRFD